LTELVSSGQRAGGAEQIVHWFIGTADNIDCGRQRRGPFKWTAVPTVYQKSEMGVEIGADEDEGCVTSATANRQVKSRHNPKLAEDEG
jgi:hypothetical protein